MSIQRINLLPESHRHALVRTYYYHLGVMVCVIGTGLAIIGAALLLPTHLLLGHTLEIKRAELATLASSQPTPGEAGVAARLKTLLANVTAITALTHTATLSTTLREVLEVPRVGITVFNINYALGTEVAPNTLMISGTARTRDALHRYQTALQEATFSRTATLPVSSYAKDVEVPFTITVTLAP